MKISILGLSCPKCKEKIRIRLEEIGVKISFFDLYQELEMPNGISFLEVKEIIDGMGTYWVEEYDSLC